MRGSRGRADEHRGIVSLVKIAVVGAGPAGAATGYHLARSGHEVVLLDRSGFPRPKVCGDWITRGAMAELLRMELPWVRLRKLAPRHAEIRGSIVGAPNGKRSHVSSHDEPGCCIPRDVFDALLVEQALGAGCRMEVHRVRDPVTLIPEHDLVVDARGVYAGRANTVAIRGYWTVPTNRVDPLTRRTVQLFTSERFRMGYGWIFPVDVGREQVEFNLGVGIWREEHDARDVKIREEFERFIEAAQFMSHLVTIQAWHADVEDGQGVVLRGQQMIGAGAVMHAVDGKATLAQGIHQRFGQFEIVFGKQDTHGRDTAGRSKSCLGRTSVARRVIPALGQVCLVREIPIVVHNPRRRYPRIESELKVRPKYHPCRSTTTSRQRRLV